MPFNHANDFKLLAARHSSTALRKLFKIHAVGSVISGKSAAKLLDCVECRSPNQLQNCKRESCQGCARIFGCSKSRRPGTSVAGLSATCQELALQALPPKNKNCWHVKFLMIFDVHIWFWKTSDDDNFGKHLTTKKGCLARSRSRTNRWPFSSKLSKATLVDILGHTQQNSIVLLITSQFANNCILSHKVNDEGTIIPHSHLAGFVNDRQWSHGCKTVNDRHSYFRHWRFFSTSLTWSDETWCYDITLQSLQRVTLKTPAPNRFETPIMPLTLTLTLTSLPRSSQMQPSLCQSIEVIAEMSMHTQFVNYLFHRVSYTRWWPWRQKVAAKRNCLAMGKASKIRFVFAEVSGTSSKTSFLEKKHGDWHQIKRCRH